MFRPPDDRASSWPGGVGSWPRIVVYGASQIILFMILFQAYKMVRKTYITRAEQVAFDNALDLLDFQGRLGLNFELSWQRWVLDRGDLILVFNNIYAYYMYGFYTCAMLLLVLNPVRYRYLRRVFITSMVVALPWYAIYPLAPPRFMEPYGWNFVDTLLVYGPNYFSNSGLVTANQYAAMPSMHCGWTMIGGIMVAAALPWPWIGRAVGLFLTLLLAVTVMVTGNHYWLDVVGGWIVVALSLAINRVLPYPLPIRWPWQRDPGPDPAVSPQAGG
jgi:membrane-associated phospholipid phosphatase